MATNAEKIIEDLALCNVTFWEPVSLAQSQLSLCRIKCLEAELEEEIGRIETAVLALADIEGITTGDDSIDDVVFELERASSKSFVWSMVPKIGGSISFSVNFDSEFFKTRIIPSVPESIVPTTDGSLTEYMIKEQRLKALTVDTNLLISVTVTALSALKAIVTTKREALEAEYSDE